MDHKEKMAELVKKLEDGVSSIFTSENYMNYLRTMSIFHSYSINNTILIYIQKPEATQVASFKTWKKLGRYVLKGEHGIKIYVPVQVKTNATIETEGEDGEMVEEQMKMLRFKVGHVFDVSQTDGEPLPQICNKLEGDVNSFNSLMDALRELAPVPIDFEDIKNGSNGYFSARKHKIAVQKDMSQAQTIKTTIHEIAHSLLHDVTVNKDCEKDRHMEEVQAESIAYVVCNCLGLDTSDYSFGYVAGWSSAFSTAELKASLNTIKETASDIIRKLSNTLNPATA